MGSEYVVIGMGRFGTAVARELSRRGESVLSIDSDPDRVEKLGLELEHVVAADAASESVLRELHVQRMDCAIVAIGTDSMENSILATALLRQLGVPKIIARSLGTLHGRVLLSVGAHRIVNPEEEIGQRVSHELVQPNVLEKLQLSENTVLIEVEIPASFVDRSPVDLRLRERFDVTVLAVRRGEDVMPLARPEEPFRTDDILVVIGSPKAVDAFASTS